MSAAEARVEAVKKLGDLKVRIHATGEEFDKVVTEHDEASSPEGFNCPRIACEKCPDDTYCKAIAAVMIEAETLANKIQESLT